MFQLVPADYNLDHVNIRSIAKNDSFCVFVFFFYVIVSCTFSRGFRFLKKKKKRIKTQRIGGVCGDGQREEKTEGSDGVGVKSERQRGERERGNK